MSARPRHHRTKRKSNSKNTTLVDSAPIHVEIEKLGQHGDGIAAVDPGKYKGAESVFIPNTLPGETVSIIPKSVSKTVLNAELDAVASPSPHRKDANCDVADQCGGCQAQIMAFEFYQDWKMDAVRSSLQKLNLSEACWKPSLITSFGGRRRARLAYRKLASGVVCGFRARRSHHIIPPKSCTILNTALMTCIDALSNRVLRCLETNSSGEVSITATDQGIDLVLYPEKAIAHKVITALIDAVSSENIARLSIAEDDGRISTTFCKSVPTLTWKTESGAFMLYPAAGSFLQADAQAEALMQADIAAALGGAEKILDLFCGSGTLSLPLLGLNNPPKRIQGFDSGADALNAMTTSAKAAGYFHHVTATERHLFKDPLGSADIDGFDAVIVDPPRAGAAQQMPHIAESTVSTVMMVSCNPKTFAQDAQVLLDNGFECHSIRMIDQFLLTPHSELVACFKR